jgi:hypothetical protein
MGQLALGKGHHCTGYNYSVSEEVKAIMLKYFTASHLPSLLMSVFPLHFLHTRHMRRRMTLGMMSTVPPTTLTAMMMVTVFVRGGGAEERE